MSAVNLIWVLPTTEVDGSALTISTVNVFRDNTQIATTNSIAAYSDMNPPSGTHSYQVSVSDTFGRVSELATATVTVPAAVPTKPNPVTGLTATYVP